MGELGMSSELITATFYKVEDPNNASTKIVFNFSNVSFNINFTF